VKDVTLGTWTARETGQGGECILAGRLGNMLEGAVDRPICFMFFFFFQIASDAVMELFLTRDEGTLMERQAVHKERSQLKPT